jgi:hypothetical protein
VTGRGVALLVVLSCAAAWAAEQPQLHRVTLEELAPSPSSNHPTTARVRARAAPAGGLRQKLGGVVVPSSCGDRYCVDGLLDRERKRELIAPIPNDDDRAALAMRDSTVQRVVHIAYVDKRSISVHLGGSEFTGGAHATNELSCATFDRHSGRRWSLATLTTPKGRRQILARARQLLSSWALAKAETGWVIDERSFLIAAYGRIVMCAIAALHRAGEVLEVDLD